ncbi:C40 family peptidase [Sporosarcina obsidiansis]|uniref:C40 family peptidase n=1 Tax=Sporosarcina obsidiansis TaxID=2660748 RepID=UPI001E496BD1|nr:C40 family peptidase [Sporosarcina obsidiansis]
MNEQWVCAVSVATVWTDPDVPRLVDVPALDQPVQLEKWLGQLSFEERLALSEEGRIQTQLLYGEPVIVEEVVGDWAKVIASWQPSRKNSYGYPGWVPLVQLSLCGVVGAEEFVRVTAYKAWVMEETGESFLRVSFNTVLPYEGQLGKRIRVRTPHGMKWIRSVDVERMKDAGEVSICKLLSVGRQFLKLPYLWGGMSAWGFDCSGLMYNLWKAYGFRLPRDAADQAKVGKQVSLDRAEWQPGDLLFFRGEENSSVSHVGMYVGNGKMLHAPSTGKSVEEIELNLTTYAVKLCGVRRVYS